MRGILLPSGTSCQKTVFLILLFLFCGLLSQASAHAPSEMTLDYDVDTHMLTVTLTHSVSDPTLHFVFRIDIEKNGSPVFSEEYSNQPTTSEFSYSFGVDAMPGDTLDVMAWCNLGGSITGSIDIGGSPSTRASPHLWPFHAAFMTGGLLLMMVALFNIFQKVPSHAWLRAHKLSGTAGVVLAIAGLLIAVYMVSQAGGSHIAVPHAYSGVITLVISFLTPVLGIGALKKRRETPSLRSIHIWIGCIALLLIVVTIISGLFQAGSL